MSAIVHIPRDMLLINWNMLFNYLGNSLSNCCDGNWKAFLYLPWSIYRSTCYWLTGRFCSIMWAILCQIVMVEIETHLWVRFKLNNSFGLAKLRSGIRKYNYSRSSILAERPPRRCFNSRSYTVYIYDRWIWVSFYFAIDLNFSDLQLP